MILAFSVNTSLNHGIRNTKCVQVASDIPRILYCMGMISNMASTNACALLVSPNALVNPSPPVTLGPRD